MSRRRAYRWASLGPALLLALALLAMHGCADEPKPLSPVGHRIAYHLWVNDAASLASTSKQPNAILEGLAGIVERIQDGSVVHAAWADWAPIGVQKQMIASLQHADSAKLHLAMDPIRLVSCPDSVLHAQPLAAPNLRKWVEQATNLASFAPDAAVLHRNRLNCNFILFRNLAPRENDDGAFGIFFMGAPWTTADGHIPIAEALWLAGDSSLYARFLDFWGMIAADESSLLAAECHTYSNLHDHLAWSFPDMQAESAAEDILSQLDTALRQTRQPAKLRLALSEIDDCHLPFVQQLVALQEKHEIDLKVVVRGEPQSEVGVLQALQKLPAGQARYFWRNDDSTETRFASNFLLIDGPYPLKEDALAEPRRLSFLFGDGFNLPALKHDWGLWLRILDRTVTDRLEDHFDSIWDMSSDTLPWPPTMVTKLIYCE